jgi:hypothetical protein
MNDLAALPLAALATFDYRADGRDPVADARAVHLRVAATLAGLPDAAWDREVSASDVPGAPAWTFRDHVGHVIDSLEDGADYTRAVVLDGARWPEEEDYGDMDAWNEERRSLFAGLTPADLRARYDAATDALIDILQGLPAEEADSDDAWGWAWSLLLDHVAGHVMLAEAALDA